ncbi:hypothetical protein V9T40_005437 [Parthenolecanium corni]|uniref:Peptidase M12B propeptide domain-containing protein n=1 Tax=Parthenolecanium corni TaxID=536013 RepID=A0AAN9TJ80_9HEMI
MDWRWGTFRNHSENFWDSSPEYTFDAFGQRFHLMLEENSAFTVPDLKVTYVSKNYSANQDPAVNPVGCFYSGYLKDDPLSDVSVSLCNGMKVKRAPRSNFPVVGFRVFVSAYRLGSHFEILTENQGRGHRELKEQKPPIYGHVNIIWTMKFIPIFCALLVLGPNRRLLLKFPELTN